jgi:hypothetical protein
MEWVEFYFCLFAFLTRTMNAKSMRGKRDLRVFKSGGDFTRNRTLVKGQLALGQDGKNPEN